MIENAQAALHSFWSGFGWTAWEENTVPENAFSRNNQYITYSAGQSGFDESMSLTGSLWERSTSWSNTVDKALQIETALGNRGMTIPYNGGVLWIKRGRPFFQRMSDEDPAVRRIYLNIEIETI